MIPSQLSGMALAEARKTLTRASGIAALALALVIGFASVLIMWKVSTLGADGPVVNGTPAAQLVKLNGVQAAGWALSARNFFLLPLLLLLATAASVAGELDDRTLRELVVRPVPRWSILAAKFLALTALSGFTLLLTLVPALGLGLALFGGVPAEAPPDSAGLLDLLGGYAATFASDLGLVMLAMATALFARSVGGTVVTLTLVLLADLVVRGVLALASTFGVAGAEDLRAFTLGNALGCWEGWETGYEPARFVALGIFLTTSLLVALGRFRRMDVP